MPARLVFIIRDLCPGGAQRQLVTLACALQKQRAFEVTVVHFYPGAHAIELQEAGVGTICVGKRHRWDLAGFGVRLARALRDARPDIVHGYLNEGNLMALMLKPFCGWPKVAWGVRDSQTDAHQWGVLGRLSFALNGLCAGFADLIIANSRAGAAYYAGRGYPEERLKVVPNGIDTGAFAPAERHLRQKWGCGSCFLLGIAGRANPMKDHGTVLRAVAGAVKCGVPLRLVIVGDGDAGYIGQLKALTLELGIFDQVIWEPARQDMAAVYSALDGLVSASSFGEGFSNVVAEAMACGLPCIVSDVGDSAQIVDDERWVFAPRDVSALTDRIVALAAMPEEDRRSLGARNRRRIVESFGTDRLARRTADLLQSLMKPKPVAFVTTGLGTGGAEMMLWQLVTRLDARRFRPTVISLTNGGRYEERLRAAGIEVESLAMPPGRPTLAGLLKLVRCLWRRRPRVLIGWMYHGCLAASFGRMLMPWRAKVFWCIRQSLYSLDLEKKGSARVIAGLARWSWMPERILYNSAKSAEQHETLGYAARKRLLTPNGFDLERWHPRAAGDGKPECLRHLNGAKLVGRFGRYAEMKDFPTFLRAAAVLAKANDHVEFVLAGTEVNEANAELKRQIGELGIAERVHLLGERDDLPGLTRALDVAVSSSAFGEGFPNVVGEAMASGVPVVATDVGDTREIVGEAGMIVPARDAQALAQACLRMLEQGEEGRQAMGEQGRRRIAERYSIAAAVSQLEGLMA